MRVSRRVFLRGLAAGILGALLAAIYAFWLEPTRKPRIRKWAIRPPLWDGPRLKIAILADLHMGEPQLPLSRLEEIVARTNAIKPDLTLFLGDLIAHHSFITKQVALEKIAGVLAKLSAPLGVFAVLGNHDWWDDEEAQKRRGGPVAARLALEREGISVMENDAAQLSHQGGEFWLAGLGDQLAFPLGGGEYRGVDDLPGTLAQIPEGAPAILMAHEPDIFPEVPERIALTLSGHTHGGQVRLFGYSPIVPSRFGNRFAYGHVREGARDIVISGGIGCSILPIRFGMPPEITLVEIASPNEI